jgi:hypothetical protein
MAASRAVRADRAYRILVDCKYRPMAPSDGCGNIDPDYDLDDWDNLEAEVEAFIQRVEDEDDMLTLAVGCPDYTDNVSYLVLIEALRHLCGMGPRANTKAMLAAAIKHLGTNP